MAVATQRVAGEAPIRALGDAREGWGAREQVLEDAPATAVYMREVLTHAEQPDPFLESAMPVALLRLMAHDRFADDVGRAIATGTDAMRTRVLARIWAQSSRTLQPTTGGPLNAGSGGS
jgi:hypothetical protein